MTYTFNNNSTPDPYNDLYWEPCKVPSTACQYIASDKSRYIYTSGDSSGSNWDKMFGEYDSYTNGWRNINIYNYIPYSANSPYNVSPIITYNKSSRFQGFIYAADSTSLSAGFLMNKTQLIGKKIRIENGSGAGQERTIIAVDDPVIVFNFTTTQMTYGENIRMSGLNMKNEYCGLSYKQFAGNSIANGITYPLYNIAQVCNATDLMNYGCLAGGNAPIYSQTSFLLRYTKVYLDSPWNNVPNISHKFSMEDETVILNGSIAPGYMTILNEYFKNNKVSIFNNNVSSTYMQRKFYNTQTLSIKSQSSSIHNSYSREEYGTATAGTFRILTDSTKTWTNNQWKNYKLKITGGSGFFQEDTIQSNDSTSITLLRSFETTMNTGSTYEIYPDDDKIYYRLTSSNMTTSSTTSPTLIQRSRKFNTEFSSKILESGVTTCAGYFKCGYEINNITMITRSGNVATLSADTTPIPFPKAGSKIVVYGVTGPDADLYNGTFTISSRPDAGSQTITYIMSGTPSDNAPRVYTATGNTITDFTKRWITNEFVGKIIIRKCDQSGENYYQYRTVISNDSTSITFYPSLDYSNWSDNNRYTHYTIFDTKSFGAIETNNNTTNGYGTATGSIPKLDLAYNPDGTYIGLIDTTKNWGINDFVGMYVKFPLLKGEIESLIVSNDATSITWSDAISTQPDQYFPYSIVDLPDSGAFGSTTQQCSLVWVSNSSDTYNKSRYLYTTAGNGNYGMYRYDISLETWVFCDLPTPVGTCIKYDEQDSLYFGDGSTDTIYKYNVVTGVTSIVGQFFGSNGNFDLDILVDQYNNTWLYCTNKNWNQMFRALLPPQS